MGQDTTNSDEIHEMLSDYNRDKGKTFYYSEKEVGDLLEAFYQDAFIAYLARHSIPNPQLWFDEHKKK